MWIGRGRTIVGLRIVALTVGAMTPVMGQQPDAAKVPMKPSIQDRDLFHQWNRSRGLVEKYLERKHGSGVGADNAVVEGEYFPSSGDKSIDDLVMIDLLWIEGRFHVSPKHFYYDDGAAPNAYWMPRSIGPKSILSKVMPNSFGTMVLGRNLVAREIRSTPKGAPRNFTIAAFVSHELGHMVQFVRKSQLSPTQRELHADFLAGWSIRCAKRTSNPELNEADTFESVYKLGDEHYFRIEHHGTKKSASTRSWRASMSRVTISTWLTPMVRRTSRESGPPMSRSS